MRLAAALALLLGAAPAAAQQTSIEVPPPILTVDQERLFTGSAFGRAASAEIERRSLELAAENRRIEAELVAEERALTDLRPSLAPDAFRQRADAFDEKVQRLRAEQDEKARAVKQLREEAQTRFFGRIAPILGRLVSERGAVAMLDHRVLLIAVEGIDITEEAIARIDAELDATFAAPENPAPSEAAGPSSAGAPAAPPAATDVPPTELEAAPGSAASPPTDAPSAPEANAPAD